MQALAEELGPVGLARFLQLTETSRGNYSPERHTRIGKLNVQTPARQIEARRKIVSD